MSKNGSRIHWEWKRYVICISGSFGYIFDDRYFTLRNPAQVLCTSFDVWTRNCHGTSCWTATMIDQWIIAGSTLVCGVSYEFPGRPGADVCTPSSLQQALAIRARSCAELVPIRERFPYERFHTTKLPRRYQIIEIRRRGSCVDSRITRE